jgi:hypothetical protein
MPAWCDLADAIPQVVEEWGAERVLRRLGIRAKPIDKDDAACKALETLATPGKRLSSSTREVADRVAFDLLNACQYLVRGLNPAANFAAGVVEAIGTRVASMVYASALGAGDVIEGWRVGKRIFVTGGDVGAFGHCDNLSELLAWWIDGWAGANIESSRLKPSLIEALGLVPSDDDSWRYGAVRINGRMWRRPARSAEP